MVFGSLLAGFPNNKGFPSYFSVFGEQKKNQHVTALKYTKRITAQEAESKAYAEEYPSDENDILTVISMWRNLQMLRKQRPSCHRLQTVSLPIAASQCLKGHPSP